MKIKLSLNTQILFGAVSGLLLGLILNRTGQTQAIPSSIIFICEIVGKIFVDLLKMILVPLVFTSIVMGIVNLRAHHQMNRIWKVTMIFFLSTPVVAAFIGLAGMNIFKPGVDVKITMFQDAIQSFKHMDQLTFSQFLKSFLSNLFLNPIAAMF